MEKKNIFKALFEFQQSCPTIYKATKNDFAKYSYADLSTIIETIKPHLKDAGLGFTQLIETGLIRTIIFHVQSGETIESTIELNSKEVQLKGMNQFQIEGSEITYKRRYSLSAILGLVTDKDTDASGEQVAPYKFQENSKPVFDMAALEKNRKHILKYANDLENFEEIETRLLTVYSGIAENVKAEIKKIVEQ